MGLWYEKFGFKENPFTIKPSGNIVGNSDLFTTISAKVAVGEVLLLTGKYGFGKSTLLKSIISRFRGRQRVIYYSCNTSDETIDFDTLLINANSFIGRLLRIRKKGSVLLLDEAQDINVRSMLLLPKYFNHGFFSSILIVTSKPDVLKLPRELNDLIAENRFSIGSISADEAVSLIRRRFNNPDFLPDSIIKQIFNYDNNPRSLLKNCEDICRSAAERSKSKVTISDVRKAFE